MKRMASVVAGCILTGGLLAAAIPADALTRQQFEDKAIPLLDKAPTAGKLLALCDEALKNDAKTDPDYAAFARVLKSHAYILRKEYAKAEAEARAVIASGYQSELGHSALMDALFATGKYDEGREICMQGADKMPDREVQIVAREDCQEMYIRKAYVRVQDLWQTFKLDAATATSHYRGQQVTVRGKVESAEKTPSGARIVMSGAGDAKNSVIFEFSPPPPPPADTDEVAPSVAVPADTKTQDKADSKPDGKSAKKGTKPTSEKDAKKDTAQVIASDGKTVSTADTKAAKEAPLSPESRKDAKSATTADDKKDKTSGSLSYSLDPDTGIASKNTPPSKTDAPAMASEDSKKEQPRSTPAEQPVPSVPAQEWKLALPPVGSTVMIAGTVRGIERGKLVLTDCMLIGQ